MCVVYSHLRLIELLELRELFDERLSAFTPAFCCTILPTTMPRNYIINLQENGGHNSFINLMVVKIVEAISGVNAPSQYSTTH